MTCPLCLRLWVWALGDTVQPSPIIKPDNKPVIESRCTGAEKHLKHAGQGVSRTLLFPSLNDYGLWFSADMPSHISYNHIKATSEHHYSMIMKCHCWQALTTRVMQHEIRQCAAWSRDIMLGFGDHFDVDSSTSYFSFALILLLLSLLPAQNTQSRLTARYQPYFMFDMHFHFILCYRNGPKRCTFTLCAAFVTVKQKDVQKRRIGDRVIRDCVKRQLRVLYVASAYFHFFSRRIWH